MIRLMPWVTRVLIIAFALSSISCSTQYMGHSDETKPYKSENMKSEVKITKQSTPSEKETTVDYLLSKSSSVENYYHGTDTYKRSSWVGVGIMVASAAVIWYGYDSYTNARESIPPYYDPNPDYEAEKQAGQRMALVGIGGVLVGAAIHFIANRELTNSTVKVDALVTSEPLPYSPIKIYHESELLSTKQTNETGNFQVDLSPFFQDSYLGRDINLSIFASEYPTVEEQLSVSANFISRLEQASRWKNAGFSHNEMENWINFGFATPQGALPWKQIGLTSSEAKFWNGKGLTPEQAQIVVEKERESKALAKAEREAARKEYENLKAQAKDMATLILTNPYDVKGRIYEVTGERFQLMSKSIGLYRARTFIFLADFGSSSAPYVFKGLARGADPYKYPTTSGAQKIVPHLNVLHFEEFGTR